MQLEIRQFQVNDLMKGNETALVEGILSLNTDELKEYLMQDERIEQIQIDFARPGESVRIFTVKDVIEPRAKMAGNVFPGLDGGMGTTGTGITCVLKGCAVVTTGPIVGFQEGVIDMSGPLTQYSQFSHVNNIVIHMTRKNEVGPHEHEEAVRLGGLRAAQFIARKVMHAESFEKKVLHWSSISEKTATNATLPKVVYVYPCMSQGLLHDTYFFGKDTKQMVPTLVSPLDLMDGAVVSGNCVSPGSKTTTYHHQNNAVIQECLHRDGKDISFIGVVITPLMTTLEEKYRNAEITVRLVEMLGADGVVQSQEGFGNPTTDMMMICQRLEARQIKTVLISNEDAGSDGRSESLPDGVEEADAIVSTGNSNATLTLPPMERVLGDPGAAEKVTGGFDGCLQPDGGMIIEIHGIMGSHNLQGCEKLGAVTI